MPELESLPNLAKVEIKAKAMIGTAIKEKRRVKIVAIKSMSALTLALLSKPKTTPKIRHRP